ncbi:MAG: protein-glutamate O-methyltransferase CheR [Pirellulaceae bacterium]|nr:protein-glutamate O-methyltransferase CheR [Pirellulaceae bacterium]
MSICPVINPNNSNGPRRGLAVLSARHEAEDVFMQLTADDFQFIRGCFEEATGIRLPADKDYLIRSRVEQLATELGIESGVNLVVRLRCDKGSSLRQNLIDVLTNNETFFFRDELQFNIFEREVLPEVLGARNVQKGLTIWSAACSSGQEAYSIAMVLLEQLAQHSDWNVNVLGTDVSSAMIETARVGEYSRLQAKRGMRDQLLEKYSRPINDKTWRVGAAVRRIVNFEHHNLMAPFPAIPRMDIVFLRNVLIYFDIAGKREILNKIRSVIAPDGYLFLGTGETLLGITDEFRQVHTNGSSYYRPLQT